MEQRIFFLGRELKSPKRSLSSLGVGNLGIFVLHLHVKKSFIENDTLSSRGNNDKKKRPDRRGRSTGVDDVIELVDSFPRSPQPSIGNRCKRAALINSNSLSNSTNAMETIDLLDDDGEEEIQGPTTTSSTNRRVKAKRTNDQQTTIDLSEG